MKTYRMSRARRDHRTLVVVDGEVMCPRRGAVTIEQCWACPAYDGLSAGHLEGVVCRADPTDTALGIAPRVR